MKSLWPEQFEASDLVAVTTVLNEQAKLLPSLTNGLVYARLVEIDEDEAISRGLKNQFNYRFDLYATKLHDYRFTVLAFSHDIYLYPVSFQVDDLIGKELGIKKTPSFGCRIVIHNLRELDILLSAAFTSQQVSTVIGSILKLSP